MDWLEGIFDSNIDTERKISQSQPYVDIIAVVLENLIADPEERWNYKTILHYCSTDVLTSGLDQTEVSIDRLPNTAKVDDIPSNKYWDIIFLTDIFFGNMPLNDLWSLADHISDDGICIALVSNLKWVKSKYNDGTFENNNLLPTSVLRLPTNPWRANAGPFYLVCFARRSKLNRTVFIDYAMDGHQDNLSFFVESHKPPLGDFFADIDDLDFYLKTAARDVNYLLDEVAVSRFAEDESLTIGIEEHFPAFPGFETWTFLTSLGELESDYKNFRRVLLKDIVNVINLTRDSFEHSENSVYIPLLEGRQSSTSSQDSIVIKHQNLCQVEVNPELVSPNYLVCYMDSDWGKTFWNAAINEKDGVIKTLNKQDIGNLLIALPPIEIQTNIFDASTKINSAIEDLEAIKNAITLNPISATSEIDKINSIRNVISEVSPLLREESKTFEFKASLRTPYPAITPAVDGGGRQIFSLGRKELTSEKAVQNFLQDIVLKTISSLMNTLGGELIIGVHEHHNKKELIGISREGFKSHDEFDRHLNQILINEFSEIIVSQYITTSIKIEKDLAYCSVKCLMKTDMPVFFRDNVYVRSGPMTNKLSTQEVAKMVANRSR